MTDIIEQCARELADAMGDDFDSAHESKAEWIDTRGEKGGRFRDVNEPRQPDYVDGARAVLAKFKELTALRAAQQWRGIESAPRDGIFEVTNGEKRAIAFRDNGMSSYRWFSFESERDLSFAPTHYRPLQPLPAGDGQ